MEGEYEAEYRNLQREAGDEPILLACYEVDKEYDVQNRWSMTGLPGMSIGWRSSLFLRVCPNGGGEIQSVETSTSLGTLIFQGYSWSLYDACKGALGFVPEGARRFVVHQVDHSDLAMQDLLLLEKALGKDFFSHLAVNGMLQLKPFVI